MTYGMGSASSARYYVSCEPQINLYRFRACAWLLAAPVSEVGAQAPPANLAGTSWQLVRIQSMDDKVATPDSRSKYTIAFGTDGRVSMRVDCNRGSGTWKSAEPGQLVFGPLAMTRAMRRAPDPSSTTASSRTWATCGRT